MFQSINRKHPESDMSELWASSVSDAELNQVYDDTELNQVYDDAMAEYEDDVTIEGPDSESDYNDNHDEDSDDDDDDDDDYWNGYIRDYLPRAERDMYGPTERELLYVIHVYMRKTYGTGDYTYAQLETFCNDFVKKHSGDDDEECFNMLDIAQNLKAAGFRDCLKGEPVDSYVDSDMKLTGVPGSKEWDEAMDKFLAEYMRYLKPFKYGPSEHTLLHYLLDKIEQHYNNEEYDYKQFTAVCKILAGATPAPDSYNILRKVLLLGRVDYLYGQPEDLTTPA